MRLSRLPNLIFWDFDGVIKESVEVKTEAFAELFQPYGSATAERVRSHHEANGGMSRFEKFPIYLQWADAEPTSERVAELCRQFAQLVRQRVIDSPWVAGAEEFLRGNPFGQSFVLVTATPRGEIEDILAALELNGCFKEVFGAPVSKKDAIRAVLAEGDLDPEECLFIGDAMADLDAAAANRVPFLLRLHATNKKAFACYGGNAVEELNQLCAELKRFV